MDLAIVSDAHLFQSLVRAVILSMISQMFLEE